MRASFSGLTVGEGLDVVVVGAVNVSPESFYAGSVVTGRDRLLQTAEGMVEAGAGMIDVGAMSTAPYRSGPALSTAEEADRLAGAIDLLAQKVAVPLSADTSRLEPARAAVAAGARVINDVTGLTGDPGLARLVAANAVGLIAMAGERGGDQREGSPIDLVLLLLEESLRLATTAGIPAGQIVLDPGIGFFRRHGLPWYEWDCRVLASLGRLGELGRPICVGVSRKSFIGALAGENDPARRLPGSLAATAAAVLAGAHLIRTHDVAETVQAVAVAQAIRRAREAR
ncbi:MAG: dihydropteroate synthase [Candidatus Rokubacteria bacterium]|nr:dihydropteroate synthase [Candidatus Rokubacteria bacterium]